MAVNFPSARKRYFCLDDIHYLPNDSPRRPSDDVGRNSKFALDVFQSGQGSVFPLGSAQLAVKHVVNVRVWPQLFALCRFVEIIDGMYAKQKRLWVSDVCEKTT